MAQNDDSIREYCVSLGSYTVGEKVVNFPNVRSAEALRWWGFVAFPGFGSLFALDSCL